VNFGPHLLALLEGTREGLQATQWAKVQKPKSYDGSNFDDNTNFLETGELWSLVSWKRFGIFFVKFGTLTWQNQKCLQAKFCGPKFRNKKVIK